MSFSKRLLELAEPYIQKEVEKPFLLEMVNGNLPLDKYQYYLKVDYPYLIDFIQILGIGISKTDSPEALKLLVSFLDMTIREIGQHESFVKKFGISPEELFIQKMGPVKYSYTRHELAIGQRGLLGELLAALLPCMWGYAEIAHRLLKQNKIQQDNPYKDWFDFYLSEDYIKQGTECMEIIDNLAMEYSTVQKKKMEEIFLISCYFEVVCWDAYYIKEEWQI